MAINLQHQTAAQFLARFSAAYRSSSREQCAKYAAWLYNRFQSGDLTQAQIRNAFNLDTQQKWDTFRIKILALRDAYQSIQDARGE